jgi:squalene-associated FAD-dependent desaturase
MTGGVGADLGASELTGRQPRAVVVGGGLAGISAALRLADAGVAVTVCEARPRLGGATHSFERDGLLVDNGQHVFLRCCVAYRELLTRLGVGHQVSLQRRLDMPVLRADGRRARLRRDALPAPLHLGAALARYRLLSPLDRLRLLPAALALRGIDVNDPALDEQDFAAWLAAHGQRKAAIDGLWNLLVVATLNADSSAASAGLAAMVFQTGLLTDAAAADIGIARVPLGALHGQAAQRALAAAGANVRLRTKVRAVLALPGGGFEVRTDDGSLDADTVVVAVPHGPAADLLSAHVPAAAGWAGLGAAPIVNLHLVYDRPVLRQPFVATVGSPLQWVFDRTEIGGCDQGQYLAVSLSAAETQVDTPTARLRELFVPEVARLFPAARRATVRRFFVTRERRATFRQAPGTARLRPAAATPVPGLLIAGAWTATGWPDTMEGAVRSGAEAARLAERYLSGTLVGAGVRS